MQKLMVCEDAIGQVVNVGADESITIRELAEKIIAMAGSKSAIRRITYEEAYGRAFDDMLVRKPDLSRIKRLIGFEPQHSLDQTLGDIIDFERARMAPSG